MNNSENASPGLQYAPGIRGKVLFRVRETYVAGPVADMISKRRVGAVKLDLVLRALALLPGDSGARAPGTVLRHRDRLSYEVLHDLCRDPRTYTFDSPQDEIDDPSVREKKRTWVGEQLQELEHRCLVRRDRDLRGRRPELVVLSDLGDGSAFDDPGVESLKGTSYVTVLGSVLTLRNFRQWGAPEVAAYLCAMAADRFARHRHHQLTGELIAVGCATWFRQADWFNSRNPHLARPEGHIPFPFSTSTIERGLRALRKQRLIVAEPRLVDPETGRRFQSGRRMVYTNRLGTAGAAQVVRLALPRPSRQAPHLRVVAQGE